MQNNPDLCRGWTEPDIRRAIAMASDDQRAILREIAAGPPVTLSQVAVALGARYEDLQGLMSGWARKTNTLDICDPGTTKPSWPWTYEARAGGTAYVLPAEVRKIVLAEAGDISSHRSFITLWSKGQLEYSRDAALQGEALDHTAGSQFRRVGVGPGDHVYVVGTDRSDLLLVGRLIVTEVLDQDAAVRRLGTNDLYEAPDHLIGSGTPMAFDRRVPRRIVAQLERSSGKPIGTNGAVTGNSLRSTGRITTASARLLDGMLTDAVEVEVVEVEVVEPQDEELNEGRRRTALQAQVERSAAARARAFEIHGADCMACGFSFSAAYGEIGDGFAEVHHLVPVASSGVREVDPREDLVVLCANCHRMIHREEPPLSVEALRECLLPAPGRPRAEDARFENDAGRRFDDLAGWKALAPPTREHHWAAGRSAMELARLWTTGDAEEQLSRLLALAPGLNDLHIESRVVEKQTFFDDIPRGPRHHDMLLTGRAAAGSVVVGIEAKADEPFDETLDGLVRKAGKRSSGTRAPERVDFLTGTLVGRRFSDSPKLGPLRYQLFSALAGTLVDAHRLAAGANNTKAAVLLIHEFQTASTTVADLERNAADLEAFVEAVAPDAPSHSDGPSWITGPFVVEGRHPLWPAKQKTFIAKLVTEIAPGPRR